MAGRCGAERRQTGPETVASAESVEGQRLKLFLTSFLPSGSTCGKMQFPNDGRCYLVVWRAFHFF